MMSQCVLHFRANSVSAKSISTYAHTTQEFSQCFRSAFMIQLILSQCVNTFSLHWVNGQRRSTYIVVSPRKNIQLTLSQCEQHCILIQHSLSALTWYGVNFLDRWFIGMDLKRFPRVLIVRGVPHSRNAESTQKSVCPYTELTWKY